MGTTAQTTLTAVKFAYAGLLPADIASIQTQIKDDSVPAANAPIYPGAFTPQSGVLYIPNRGFLMVKPGDYVAIDTTTGWPILVSARAAASVAWVHAP